MSRLRAVTLWLLVLATTAGSVRITMRTGVPAVWAANGIAAWALLGLPSRARARSTQVSWPALLPLVLLCTTVGNMLGGRPAPIAGALGLVNTAEVVVLVLALRWRTDGSYTLASWPDLRRTVGACVLGGLVFAVGATIVMTAMGTGFDLSWSAWSVGSHLAGSLVVLPLAADRSPVTARPPAPEVICQVAVLVIALTAVFTSTFNGNATFLVPALLWAAARFPPSWASRQLAAVAVVVTALTLADLGPFVMRGPAHTPHAMTTSVQTFLVLSALLTLAFSTSVAAERAAVARYLRQEAGMGRLLESAAGTAFIATDVHGRITLFNTGAERLLGYDSDEVVGLATPLDFHLAGEVDARAAELGMEAGFPAVVAANAGDDEFQDRHWTWVCKDGRQRVVSLSRAIVRDHWGRPNAYLLIARDVTESLAAEQALRSALATERDLNQRLRELDVAKSDFIANVSHELRTPLATIIGCTELLEDGVAGELSTAQGDLLERINRNGVRLLGLIEDLLTLGAVSQGQFAITSSDVDLCAVVRQSVAALAPDDVRRVAIDVPPSAVAVGGDPDQLLRLVDNLLGNACKFTPSGGQIRIGVRPGCDAVRLEVTDTGVGIAWEDQPLVFERFFRSRSTREAELPGTGLGLSIVRSIAEAHGAVVECVSTPGAGSTFAVAFPTRSPVALAG
jgi:signal transduction histidine kinase